MTLRSGLPHTRKRIVSGRIRRSAAAAVASLAALSLVTACSYGSKSTDKASAAPAAASGASDKKLSADTVKIGYFANLTHGTPLVGLQEGLFQK
ncbi:sulfate ABC transporter substrate-binding protein, partial [Kitasatospora sp. NPDC048540]